MKIFLADQDVDLVEITAYYLMRQGHQVSSATDGDETLRRLSREAPDVLVLGSSLPGVGGSELCKKVRDWSPIPVVILGSCNSEQEILTSLESGADDYVAKPFSSRQLLLRINNLLRRCHRSGVSDVVRVEPPVQVADLLLDPDTYKATKCERSVLLTKLEFRILYYLAKHADHLVDVTQLCSYSWQSPSQGDSNLLKTHISHIRQKLTSSGGDTIHIRAIHRTGYMLVVDRPLRDGAGCMPTARNEQLHAATLR